MTTEPCSAGRGKTRSSVVRDPHPDPKADAQAMAKNGLALGIGPDSTRSDPELQLRHVALAEHEVHLANLACELLVRFELLQAEDERVFGEDLGRLRHRTHSRRLFAAGDHVRLRLLLRLD